MGAAGIFTAKRDPQLTHGSILAVPRRQHTLSVSDAERDRIRALYLQGVRVADIARRLKRSEAIVTRKVRGLKRPKPGARPRNTARDARMVEMHTQGFTFEDIAVEFGISATRACEIVGILTGKRGRRPRVRTEVSKLPRTKRTVPRLTRAQLTRRNATIESLWREGVSYAQLARRFMIHRVRVKEIVLNRLRRRGESLERAKRRRSPERQ